ncbi:MAG: glycoside hydrolase family 3 C-terminal domain-containing protein [Clostridium neonatale]
MWDSRSLVEQDFEEAIDLAKNSDYTIVAIGGSSARDFDLKFENNGAALIDDTKKDVNCGENVDLANLDLDGLQVELVRELSETGTKVIVVLIQGRPHSIGNILDFSDAVLCAWYPGKMGGEAIAETIFGINNPNGKLAVSIPVSSMQLPCYYNAKDSGAKIDYLDMSGLSLFPFGFGLSYTNFVYDKLRFDNEVTIEDLLKGKEVSIHVNIKNCGDFDGYEVAQLYIRDEESSITRRVKELKGFKKVFIKSGEEVDVEFKLGFKELSIWDYNLENRVEPGEVSIMVGKNSIDYIEKGLFLI